MLNGSCHPLLLAAGELSGIAIEQAGAVDQLRQVAEQREERRTAHEPEAGMAGAWNTPARALRANQSSVALTTLSAYACPLHTSASTLGI